MARDNELFTIFELDDLEQEYNADNQNDWRKNPYKNAWKKAYNNLWKDMTLDYIDELDEELNRVATEMGMLPVSYGDINWVYDYTVNADGNITTVMPKTPLLFETEDILSSKYVYDKVMKLLDTDIRKEFENMVEAGFEITVFLPDDSNDAIFVPSYNSDLFPYILHILEDIYYDICNELEYIALDYIDVSIEDVFEDMYKTGVLFTANGYLAGEVDANRYSGENWKDRW